MLLYLLFDKCITVLFLESCGRSCSSGISSGMVRAHVLAVVVVVAAVWSVLCRMACFNSQQQSSSLNPRHLNISHCKKSAHEFCD